MVGPMVFSIRKIDLRDERMGINIRFLSNNFRKLCNMFVDNLIGEFFDTWTVDRAFEKFSEVTLIPPFVTRCDCRSQLAVPKDLPARKNRTEGVPWK